MKNFKHQDYVNLLSELYRVWKEDRVNIKEQIIEEIELLAKADIKDDNEIIFGKDKLLDSLNILHILLFIEITFNLKIDTKELTIANFNTVNKIVLYVEKKL